MSQPPTLRPLSVGEIIDAGIKIYRRNWRVLFAISATVVVPLGIVNYIVALFAAREIENLPVLNESNLSDFDFSVFYGWIGLALASGLLSFLALLVVNAAALRAVADGYMGEVPDRRSSLSLAVSRLGTLVGVTILQMLAIAALFVLPIVLIAAGGTGGAVLGALTILVAVVVAIYLGISWTMAVPSVVVEKTGSAESLGRSMSLVSGRWWPVFGVIVLVAIIRSVIGAVVGIGSGVIFFAAPENIVLAATVDTLQAMLTDIVLLPFAAAITAVLYFDLRVRKEGFDLELLARSIGSEWDPSAEPPWQPKPEPPSDPDRWSGREPPGSVWPPLPSDEDEPESPRGPEPGVI